MSEVTTQGVSETPIETKLCPYRKTFGEKYEDHQIEIDGLFKEYSIRGEVFGYCLQEKCAMWVDKRFIYLPTGEVLRDDNYCGLAGRP